MFWKGPGDIRSRRLSKGEQEAYNAGYDDGVGMVIDRLSGLDPDDPSAEARELVKELILSHAVETTSSD
ncbi:MAG: hypothetical protein QNJ20_06900 [Paracoccaceae bacterium]|nr:hypothetical protein [Paracoccaceae bacterium]